MNINLPTENVICNYWVEPNIIGSTTTEGDTNFYYVHYNALYPISYDRISSLDSHTCIDSESIPYKPENAVYFQHLAFIDVALIFCFIYLIMFKRFIK